MVITAGNIVEVQGDKKFLVLDVKKIKNKVVALLQGVEDGFLRFATEEVDINSKSVTLKFINDKELEMAIAKEFDRQRKES